MNEVAHPARITEKAINFCMEPLKQEQKSYGLWGLCNWNYFFFGLIGIDLENMIYIHFRRQTLAEQLGKVGAPSDGQFSNLVDWF